MSRPAELFHAVDRALTGWMARHGVTLLRLSLGVVFLWFGFLKFFPSVNPPEEIAVRTIHKLSFGVIPDPVAVVLLATLESVIGIGLIAGRFLRFILFLLFAQMLGTLTPLFLFPSEAFSHVPYAPTMLGQYVIKNIVFLSAALVIGATVRGARMKEDSEKPAAWPPAS
ncbi:MAG: DoxX family membrane protein [Verrucomicrobia bacterium]|nr:DoxX family membrane protein [Verrucomicrobiota bacterium]